jgi:hypothetical protein
LAEAGAGIAEGEPDIGGGTRLSGLTVDAAVVDGDGEKAAARHGVAGLDGQKEDGLFEFLGIREDRGGSGARHHREGHEGAQKRRQHQPESVGQSVKVQQLRLAGWPAGESKRRWSRFGRLSPGKMGGVDGRALRLRRGPGSGGELGPPIIDGESHRNYIVGLSDPHGLSGLLRSYPPAISQKDKGDL